MRLTLVLLLLATVSSCARRHVPTAACKSECESAETICKEQAAAGFGNWNCPARHQECLTACPSAK